MAYKEMFFVQTFGFTAKNRLMLMNTYSANSTDHAIMRAEAYSARGTPGAIAFSQMVDSEADDAQEPTLLAAFGSVPPEAKAAA